MAIVQPIAMLTALLLSVKKNSQLTQRISFLFYGVSLVILCIFGENVSFLYPLFAILNSFGAGYYYSIYSAQMLTYTTDRNRDQISGLIAIFGSIISVAMPLLSGLLISAFDSFIGYRIIFGLFPVSCPRRFSIRILESWKNSDFTRNSAPKYTLCVKYLFPPAAWLVLF